MPAGWQRDTKTFILGGAAVAAAALAYTIWHDRHVESVQKNETRPIIEAACHLEPMLRGEDASSEARSLEYLHLDVLDEADLGYPPKSWNPPHRSTNDLVCTMRLTSGQPALDVTTFVDLYFRNDAGTMELPPTELQFSGNVTPDEKPLIRFANLGRAPVRIAIRDGYGFTTIGGERATATLADVQLPMYYLDPGPAEPNWTKVHGLYTFHQKGASSLIWIPKRHTVIRAGTDVTISLPQSVINKLPPYQPANQP
jgi:hypothetical protein